MIKVDNKVNFHVLGGNEMLKSFLKEKLHSSFPRSQINLIEDQILRLPFNCGEKNHCVICVYPKMSRDNITYIVSLRRKYPELMLVCLTEPAHTLPKVIFDKIDADVMYSVDENITGLIRSIISSLSSNKSHVSINNKSNVPLNTPLTQKENEVLSLLGMGMSNKEIANMTEKASSTVKVQLRAIYKKLGVNSRSGAILCKEALHKSAEIT